MASSALFFLEREQQFVLDRRTFSLWLRTSDAHSSMSAFEAPAEAHVHLSSSQASKTALCLTSLLPGPPLPLQSPLACHLECPNQLFLVESSSALG